MTCPRGLKASINDREHTILYALFLRTLNSDPRTLAWEGDPPALLPLSWELSFPVAPGKI